MPLPFKRNTPSDIETHQLLSTHADDAGGINIVSSGHEERPTGHQAGTESPDISVYIKTNPREGLTDAEVQARLRQFGRNELAEVKKSSLFKFLAYFTGPIAYLIEIACILSAITRDWVNFGIILVLLIVNAVIGFVEEHKAEAALDALKNTLSSHARVVRNGGQLVDVSSAEIVPGDIVLLRIGDIAPADAQLLGIGSTGETAEGEFQVDESALTGESLPVSKQAGDSVYSSSIIKQGQQLGVVTKTGASTFIGRAASLISITVDQGHFQKTVSRIGHFLIAITIIIVAIIFVIDIVDIKLSTGTVTGQDVLDSLEKVLVLTIAAIPIGLPTALSVTMAVGAKQLSYKQVIVKKLTAVEQMASMNILCADKTGTLTKNELTMDEPWLGPSSSPSNTAKNDLALWAYLSVEPGSREPIDVAIHKSASQDITSSELSNFTITSFLPFNPTTKMTQATITVKSTGQTLRVVKGAPQVILQMVRDGATRNGDRDMETRCDEAQQAVLDYAQRGLRAIGIARTDPNHNPSQFRLVGLVSLLDPPRDDSAATIAKCREIGISLKMLTGDQVIIGKEVAKRLGLGRVFLGRDYLVNGGPSNHANDSLSNEERFVQGVIKADGFGGVVPEDKFQVVDILQQEGYIVGMTGDGVNDAPALKKANIGIAVHNCTDAARSAADIVLLHPGLSTIIEGVSTSRAIFSRMRSYALYSIISTLHFLIFFFLITVIEDYQLPAFLLVIICVLNDAATVVISVDNAEVSAKPNKWRLGQLLILSAAIAIILVGASFAHYYIAKDVLGVTRGQLDTIMYLHISSCPHFIIFSSRTTGRFWQHRPSILFTSVIIATQIIALLFSVYAFLSEAIPWSMGIIILLISLVIMVIADFVKVAILSSWTHMSNVQVLSTHKARAAKLKKRFLLAQQERVIVNWQKVRQVVLLREGLELLMRGTKQLSHDDLTQLDGENPFLDQYHIEDVEL
ncbi:hypothetical protein BZG36_00868 [Bifiguratus adelaidae]|uniref:Plasma membrane ATPase n=1 Tax=Bifiguratus adelaidae TaxID=1938954 RepID=A0A261Y5H8_9FUNG|nr:hypothetical protein BZG36_00868 [Bifiguratus adelaidae]